MKQGKISIGELLVQAGAITRQQLEETLREQSSGGGRLGSLLVERGYTTEADIARALEKQLGVPYVRLSEVRISPSCISKVPANFASKHKIVPISEDNGVLKVAVSDPLDIHTLDDIRLFVGMSVEPVLSTEKEIKRAIKQYYGVGADTVERMVKDSKSAVEILDVTEGEREDLEDMATDASIIKFVNQVVLEAYRSRATDIHIEPFENELRIRYRIDGILHETTTPPTIKRFQSAIVSRVKIMAELNIAEKRLPQDGRIKVRIGGEELDLRVSIIPTLFGESVNIRLLTTKSVLLGLEQLGIPGEQLEIINELIKKPHGIILVTGPTGCGKTTSLYACLSKINSPELKIITIEDPIEYQLMGISQMQVRPKIDFTFAVGLRSILRQDPDVIMVGEIRDSDTASIAIRAALTGHLVFSTLHTNDAAGGVARLIDMGMEPFLVSSSVEAIIAQRLVRVICPGCRSAVTPDVDYLKRIGFPLNKDRAALYQGRGCDDCRGTGFKGRSGLYEILVVDEAVRRLVLQKASAGEIKEAAVKRGMRTIRDMGWERVIKGETTIDEVLRVAEEN